MNILTQKIMIRIVCLLLLLSFASCSSDDKNSSTVLPEETEIRGADFSFVPEARAAQVEYINAQGQVEDPLLTFKNAGGNYVRLRLWHSPSGPHSGFQEVKNLAQEVRQMGLKVWLTVHYSDTWADPGDQQTPQAWNSMNFQQLKGAAVGYTSQIMNEIQPDIIQIGNEINVGLMHPHGHLINQEAQCLELLQGLAAEVRAQNTQTKIMMHFAGLNAADWFFNKVAAIDYDYIGLSFYPIWHGTSLSALSTRVASLGQTHQKKVVLAEVAYPFTLSWNDWTNNIVGLPSHLVTGHPASPGGQRSFLQEIRQLMKADANGLGFCYWGTEWVAFYGPQASNGSTWENQALWDFDNKVLPAMQVFNRNE